MEYRNVPVKQLKPDELKEVYLPTLPPEVLRLREEDAMNELRNEFISTNSANMYSQLQKDCSLDALTCTNEHNTLEEVVQVIPDRSPDIMPLNTLVHLPKSNMHSMSRTSLLGLLDRVSSPSVDLSYNNTLGEWHETSTIAPEVLVTIGVYKPISVPQLDLCVQARYMIMSQRLVFLASQSLSVLKDAIRCPQDKVWLGNCSDALDNPALHIAAEKLYTSSYFFIEGTFYDDMRNVQNKVLSKSFIEWATTKKELNLKGPFSQKSMEATHLCDLRIHVGKPYFYVHQGNCEHAFVFTDLQMLDRHACQNPSMYPILTGRCYLHAIHCFICRRLNARWLTSNAGTLLPVDPCPLCDVCLRLLLYDDEGEKIDPKISVHMCCGDEVIVI